MAHRILVSAVEASADRLAAELLRELATLQPHHAWGSAGPAMRREGVEALVRAEDLAVNGLWEVLTRLSELRAARQTLERELERADLLLVVDAPDFNLPLARVARSRGIPVVGYVSPQVWAWRPGRARTLARSLDRLLCLFPFEPAWYEPHGLDARFVGHPVVDRLADQPRHPEEGVFALLPGSRPEEIQRLLPVFLDTARALLELRPGARFVLGAAPGLSLTQLEEAAVGLPLTRVEGLLQAAAAASAALVSSGTATLELAVLGVPMVVAYQVHSSTYWAGRLLVKGVKHIALPNILAGKQIVAEHIQSLDPERLAADLIAAASSVEQPRALAGVRDSLGAGGASRRAAESIMDLLRP